MKWRVRESREEKKQTKKQNRKGEGTATQTHRNARVRPGVVTASSLY